MSAIRAIRDRFAIRWAAWLCAGAWMSGALCATAAPKLAVTIEPTSVTLGQPVRITATVPSEGLTTAAFRLAWPDGQDPSPAQATEDAAGWTTWTLLTEGPVLDSANRTAQGAFQYQWRLIPFVDGELPGPEVVVIPEANGGPLPELREATTTVTVGGTRAATDENLRALRPPVVVPLPGWIWAIAGGALLLATAAIAYLAYSWMRKRSRIPGHQPTPEETVLQHLEQLEALELPKAKRFREYFTRLSDEVRLYLETRWQLPAPELTTAELRNLMENTQSGLPEQAGQAFLELLKEADTVKFAKGLPSAETCSRCLLQTRSTLEAISQEMARRAEEQRRAEEVKARS